MEKNECSVMYQEMGYLKKSNAQMTVRQKRSKGQMANRSISKYQMGDTETEGSASANTYT